MLRRNPGFGRELVHLEHLAAEGNVDALLAMLHSEKAQRSARLRSATAKALGQTRNPGVTPELVSLLLDEGEHSDVRLFAAIGLGEARDEGAVPAVAQLLRQRSSAALQVRAVVALGEIGGTSCIEPLVSALRSDQWVVRENAADALGKIDDESVVDPLVACLSDRRQRVRLRAAQALARVGDDGVIHACGVRKLDRAHAATLYS
jgi:HEAT repeat protein